MNDGLSLSIAFGIYSVMLRTPAILAEGDVGSDPMSTPHRDAYGASFLVELELHTGETVTRRVIVTEP